MKTFEDKPLPFKTEEEARIHAATQLPDYSLAIIHSPNKGNHAGDYYIDTISSMVRTWETVLYVGRGIGANRPNRKSQG